MIDIKLNNAHDIIVEDLDLALVDGIEEIGQSVKIRILFIQAEWVFDYTLGIPWYDGMFTIKTSLEQKQQILKSTILNTVGIISIIKFVFGVDPLEHLALVDYEAETDIGTVEGEIYAP